MTRMTSKNRIMVQQAMSSLKLAMIEETPEKQYSAVNDARRHMDAISITVMGKTVNGDPDAKPVAK